MTKANEWADLKKFNASQSRIGGTFITINPKGVIILSAGFINIAHEQLLNKTHAIFAHSSTNKAIVMNFINDSKQAGSMKITGRKFNNGSISAKSFFNWSHINLNEIAGKYLPKFEPIPSIGNRWVIYLDESNKK